MSEQRITQAVYIKASLKRVWDALTNPDVTEKYWGKTRIESDWQVGSKIFYVRDGQVMDEHTIVEIERPLKLVHTFHPLYGEFKDEPPSKVSIHLQAGGDVVRLALVHDGFPANSKVYLACSEGWPMILSGMKTLLETGSPMPEFAPSEKAHDIVAIARASYEAYVAKDRAAIEKLIADDFHFTSPLDNRIDRATYFDRCWPQSERAEGFEFINLVPAGDRVFVTYEGRMDGNTFRNTEIVTVRGGQIVDVEVYFGWSIPHKAKPSGFLESSE